MPSFILTDRFTVRFRPLAGIAGRWMQACNTAPWTVKHASVWLSVTTSFFGEVFCANLTRNQRHLNRVSLQPTVPFEGSRPLWPLCFISPNKWRTLICFSAMFPRCALSSDRNSIVTRFDWRKHFLPSVVFMSVAGFTWQQVGCNKRSQFCKTRKSFSFQRIAGILLTVQEFYLEIRGTND